MTARAPRLAVLGSAVVDRVATAAGARDYPGGAALNAAVGARRLGADVTLVAVVGDDAAGGVLRGFLREEGVALAPALALGSTTAIVESERSEGAVSYRFRSSTPSGRLRLDAEHRELVRASGAVALSAARFGLGRDLEELLESLDACPGPRLYDANPRRRDARDLAEHRDEFERIVGHVDLVKLATEDLEPLGAGTPGTAAGLLDRGPRAVVLTDGPRGATILTREGAVRAASRIRPDEVVDAMGAGDATLASIAVDLLHDGWPASREGWQGVLDRAMTTAGLACRAAGGATAMPGREAVRAALASA